MRIFTAIFFTFLISSQLLQANKSETEVFSRVKITLEGKEVVELAKLGLALQPNDFEPGVSFTGEFSKSELDIISEAGFEYEVLIQDVSEYYQNRNIGLDKNYILNKKRSDLKNTKYPVPENFTLGSMGGFHTYDELLADLDLMHELFPHLISERLPISDLNSIQNRPIYWVRISNTPNDTTDKPKVLYTALLHAREPASMQQMLFQMWSLLENYETDPEVQYLVDNLEMYFVPCVNPDGYIYCETTHPDGGSMHRKNMRINDNGSIGVDLNRNFGYKWGYDNWGSSPDPSTQIYRGTGPFSEPETENLKIFSEAIDFSLALNNHTYSDLLIYPWGYESFLTHDSMIFINYAEIMTRKNNYIYGTVHETLYYTVNGGSDDWFYGEQETKNKVFAFTPEAGSPHDGFWPAIDRIVDICAGHVHMNNYLAHLALPYAEMRDISGRFVNDKNSLIQVEVTNMGQYSPANYTISIEPITQNIIEIGRAFNINDMDVLQVDSVYIELNLSNDINPGDMIKYVVNLNNGLYQWNDTIVRYFGTPEVLFFDPCDDMQHWQSLKWAVCNNNYFSPPGSIADSPGTSYSFNTNASITTKNQIDLRNAVAAGLSFKTRYVIEPEKDYVQLTISVDNEVTWTPLQGKYSDTGTSFQDPGQPVYQGIRDFWSPEEVDLTPYVGNKVWLRFTIKTNHRVNWEGFYFDDFTLKAVMHDSTSHIADRSKNDIRVYYNDNDKRLYITMPAQRATTNIYLSISDITGKNMYNSQFSESSFSIDLKNYRQGVYIVAIWGDFQKSKKFVITR